jgi:hypothetical protein
MGWSGADCVAESLLGLAGDFGFMSSLGGLAGFEEGSGGGFCAFIAGAARSMEKAARIRME